ncbi:MAG TPA: GNAT family N-acetyltransferase [Egibacteraceae bacterium]|jgi:ElaA protein|nr:GNAT family N-acetyltransferase [Egibacteraceae bacterium]
MALHSAAFADLDPFTLYGLLRLRVDVFVVEQACPYPDLDGRDLEPGARHHWAEEDGRVVACLRVLAEPDGSTRIGRVATAAAARRRGLAEALLRAALAEAPRPVVLAAQTRIAAWYEGFGFTRDGADYVDDGILHTPMRLR